MEYKRTANNSKWRNFLSSYQTNMAGKRKDVKNRENKQKNRLAKQQRNMLDQLENEIIDQAFIIIEELMDIITKQLTEPEQTPESNQYQSRGIVNARTNQSLNDAKQQTPTPTRSDTTPSDSNVTMEVNAGNRGNTNSSQFQYSPASDRNANINLSGGSQQFMISGNNSNSNSSGNALFDRLRAPTNQNRQSIINPAQVTNAIRNQNMAPRQQTEQVQTIVGADAFQFANRLVGGNNQSAARAAPSQQVSRAAPQVSRAAPQVSRAAPQASRAAPTSSNRAPSSMRAPNVAIAA